MATKKQIKAVESVIDELVEAMRKTKEVRKHYNAVESKLSKIARLNFDVRNDGYIFHDSLTHSDDMIRDVYGDLTDVEYTARKLLDEVNDILDFTERVYDDNLKADPIWDSKGR